MTSPSIDHINININININITVTDLTASRAFYDAVLLTVGVEDLFDIPADGDQPAMIGYGQDPKPFFWLVDGKITDPNLHLAFAVDSRQADDTFYAAAIAAGATTRDEPAVHPEYHPDYYGTFVNDPDGTNLEAVCHDQP